MEKTEKKHHRKALWFIAFDIVLGTIILCLCLILLKHKPAAYAPEAIAEPNKAQVNTYLTHEIIAKFYNGIQTNEPFSMELDQKGVNEAIVQCGWPQFFNGTIISTPVIAFERGKISVMGEVMYDGAETVLTVELTPKFDPTGQFNVNISKVKAGAIGITFIAKRMARKMFTEQFGAISESDDLVMQLIASAFADKPFDPIFKIDKRRYRMDTLDIDTGRARVHFVPHK